MSTGAAVAAAPNSFDVSEAGVWEFGFDSGEQIVLMSWAHGVSSLDRVSGSQFAPTTHPHRVQFVKAPISAKLVLPFKTRD